MAVSDDLRQQFSDVLTRIAKLPKTTERQKLLEDAFYAIASLIELRVSVGEMEK